MDKRAGLERLQSGGERDGRQAGTSLKSASENNLQIPGELDGLQVFAVCESVIADPFHAVGIHLNGRQVTAVLERNFSAVPDALSNNNFFDLVAHIISFVIDQPWRGTIFIKIAHVVVRGIGIHRGDRQGPVGREVPGQVAGGPFPLRLCGSAAEAGQGHQECQGEKCQLSEFHQNILPDIQCCLHSA